LGVITPELSLKISRVVAVAALKAYFSGRAHYCLRLPVLRLALLDHFFERSTLQ
jgi:hypothetical protein